MRCDYLLAAIDLFYIILLFLSVFIYTLIFFSFLTYFLSFFLFFFPLLLRLCDYMYHSLMYLLMVYHLLIWVRNEWSGLICIHLVF